MREGDGPQRGHFKRQVAAYVVMQGPSDEVSGPALSPTHAAELLEMTPPGVCNARERIRARMSAHVGFESMSTG